MYVPSCVLPFKCLFDPIYKGPRSNFFWTPDPPDPTTTTTTTTLPLLGGMWRRPLQRKEWSSSQGTYKHTYIQTNIQMDIATLWLNQPSGPIQWKSIRLQTVSGNDVVGKTANSFVCSDTSNGRYIKLQKKFNYSNCNALNITELSCTESHTTLLVIAVYVAQITLCRKYFGCPPHTSPIMHLCILVE